jgi:hypothetical protein
LDIRLKIAITIAPKSPSILSPWPLWGHFNHSLKRDTRQQSTEMKLETIVAMALLNRFTLSFLWSVVEYGPKGHCHGQLDERRLSSFLVVHKLLNPQHFGLLMCQFDFEIERRDSSFTKTNRCFAVYTTS